MPDDAKIIVGIPAKRVGDVSKEQTADIAYGASEYVDRTGRRWEVGARVCSSCGSFHLLC
jgi:hypothetical protein